MTRSLLATAILSALLLTACGGGGGGGNVRPEAPPPTPPTEPDPGKNPDPGEEDPDPGQDPGPGTDPAPDPGPGPTRYFGTADNVLVGTNADLAREQGFTGEGVKIGLLDDKRYDYETLEHKVPFYWDYTDQIAVEDPEENKKRGHGAVIAATMVGSKVGEFKGGIAPDADLYWGRICVDDSCRSDKAKAAADEMVDLGVRLFNLSVGSFKDTNADKRSSSLAWGNSFDKAVQAGSLVVVSAGNDGKDTAGFPAGAPEYLPELAGNWLAVTAVDLDDNGEASGKSSYANSCGAAAQWCLAAPGLVEIPKLEGTEYQWAAQGTSMSAGLVTSVGALVMEAFPWMDGHNVQQTLLTTATDLGEKGVDSTFGWGLVDAEKAVKGPAQFNGDDFVASVTSFSVFANDISGDFGLVKEGTSLLRLDGENTFAGDVIVNSGVLGVAGSLASSVALNGQSQYNSFGGSIGGDFVAGAETTTRIPVGSPITVGGIAILDGTLEIQRPRNEYEIGGTENLITAGVIEGVYATVKAGTNFFWDFDVSYSDTSVDAELTRASASATAQSIGATQAVIDGASQMDTLVGLLDQRVASGNTAGLAPILGATGTLISADDGAAATALASLTGHVHGVQRTIAVQSVMNDARMLADRLPHLASTSAPTAWAQGYHVDGELDRTGYATADYRQDAFSVGIDVPVGGWVVGGALTKGENRADVAFTRSRLEADHVGFSAYAYKPFGRAYLSAVAGMDEFDVDSRRDVLDGETARQVLTERDESSWHARFEAGVNLSNGFAPFAAIGAISHEQEAFAEEGANGLGLSAGTDKVTMEYADVGIRHNVRSGAWTFNSLIAHRNVYDADNTGFDAWFTGAPDAVFAVEGQPLPEDSTRVSVGASYALSRSVRLYGNVGIERGSDEHDNTSALLGLRWAF